MVFDGSKPGSTHFEAIVMHPSIRYDGACDEIRLTSRLLNLWLDYMGNLSVAEFKDDFCTLAVNKPLLIRKFK